MHRNLGRDIAAQKVHVLLWQCGHNHRDIRWRTGPENGAREVVIPIRELRGPLQPRKVAGQRYTRTIVTITRSKAEALGLIKLSDQQVAEVIGEK